MLVNPVHEDEEDTPEDEMGSGPAAPLSVDEEPYDPAIHGPREPEPLLNWGHPREWPGLCALMAEYCESDDPRLATPVLDGPLDADMDSIRADLIELNRAGFMTVGAQPGLDDVYVSTETGTDARWVQRAYVSLLVPFRYHAPLREALIVSDLIVLTAKWTEPLTTLLPMTTVDGVPVAWFGSPDSEELELWQEQLNAVAFRHVSHAFRVEVMDAAWGRERFLWDTLTEIVNDLTA